ncbi:hypothetical protein [Lysinibacillus agricola]|uniref:hypothetical protein n=1 Tax=Lysinibacillus agricola TaxID=2590012 RepID=UPI003C23D257
MSTIENVTKVVLNMPEDEVKAELITLLSLENDDQKLIHLNTLTKRVANELVGRRK